MKYVPSLDKNFKPMIEFLNDVVDDIYDSLFED